MECNKWEEEGLLFTAHELHEHLAAGFQAHCKECAFCAAQVEQYLRDKAVLFTRETLGAHPSERVDTAVAAACAHPFRIAAAHWSLFSLVKKSAVPVLLFILGFGAGTYFVLNIQNAKTAAPAVAENKINSVVPADTADSLKQFKMAGHDSLKKPMDRPFNAPAGNAAGSMVPVKE